MNTNIEKRLPLCEMDWRERYTCVAFCTHFLSTLGNQALFKMEYNPSLHPAYSEAVRNFNLTPESRELWFFAFTRAYRGSDDKMWVEFIKEEENRIQSVYQVSLFEYLEWLAFEDETAENNRVYRVLNELYK